MNYKRDLWEIAAPNHGIVTVSQAADANVPAVEVRKLASRGALERQGQGIYVHRDIPPTSKRQPAVAVALGGDGAFLERESVLDLLELGQFNPKKIRVGSRRRVRRTLPEWIALEQRRDITDDEITSFHGIPTTTVRRSLIDMHCRMPRERWRELLHQTLEHNLLEADVAAELMRELV